MIIQVFRFNKIKVRLHSACDWGEEMDVTEMVLSEEQENSLHAAIEQVTNIQEKVSDSYAS